MYAPEDMELIRELCVSGTDEDDMPCFLSKWRPVELLGHGTYGGVYLIERGGKRCAVKIMRFGRKLIEHYKNEIEALTRIKNEKNAVDIYEYETVTVKQGSYSGKYLVIRMEYLNKLPEKMTEDEVIELALQICSVLEVCHNGEPIIYHRDIKPSNILVTDSGTYKLTDFGEAKIAEQTRNMSGFRGTPLYMSTEMHDFKGYDGRSDLYSLGVTMYALLSGSAPFMREENGDMTAAIRRRFSGEILPNIHGVSRRMMQIIRRLCMVDPADRYRTAADLAQVLRSLAVYRAEHYGSGAGSMADDYPEEDGFANDGGYDFDEVYDAPSSEDSGNYETNSANTKTKSGERQSNASYNGARPHGFDGMYISIDSPFYGNISDDFDPFGGGDGSYSPLDVSEYNPDPYYLPEHLRDKPKKRLSDAVKSQRNLTTDGESAAGSAVRRRKRNALRLLFSLAALLALWTAVYCTVPALYLEFAPVSGGYEVISCSSLKRNASVPSEYKGEPVVSIGGEAFDGCDRMRSLYISENVVSISTGGLDGTQWLDSIKVSKKNSSFSGTDGVLFSRDGSRLCRYPQGREGHYSIPDSVAVIAPGAFRSCMLLSSVNIPDGVVEIGTQAFAECGRLSTIYIPESVNIIGNAAFEDCNVTVRAGFVPESRGYSPDDGVYWVII